MRLPPFRRARADLWRGKLVPQIAVLCLLSPSSHGESIAGAWQGTYWGESSGALLAHFGARATALSRPLDFGDSYADVVLRNVPVGGFPLIAYFQMDKRTGGLKRIQLERPRHGVTPPAFRGVLGALEAAYGTPDTTCGVRPGPASGYQAAAERIWSRDGVVIRAIFRATTIEAFEGCPGGDLTSGPCGLTAQLLVRISPPGGDPGQCPVPPSAKRAGARH
ncbi:MAG TPA: hypothetical protein VEK82_09405 [Stellaceae bacterium]|nr:hypothetical protein [Stellaceae bacterium]